MLLLLLFLVGHSECQEVSTPSSLLRPKHFNHHAFDAEQYLKSLNLPVPTKQGPVLFPNDAPPAPRTPLIVTSRPLIESIAKSELNSANNTEAQSSNNGVSFVPYFGRVKEYKPFYGVGQRPFGNIESQSPLPPIYKVISNHHQQKPYDYKVKSPDYNQHHENEIQDDNSADYNNAQNYAFSYTVKDKNTGDDFSHSQHSSGSATNGEYRVRLPDGRMQIVSYTADENGYNAEVRYDDEDKTSNNAINSNSYDDISTNTIKPTDYIINDYRKTDFNNNYNYISTTKSYDHDLLNDNKLNNNDYSNDYDKLKLKNDYTNYDSKEFYNDYSSEFNNNYPSYTSKFKPFVNDKVNDYVVKPFANDYVVSTTIKPSYNDIRDLLVDEKIYNTRQSYNDVDQQDYSPSNFKNDLFTNVNDVVAITPRSYVNAAIATTPRSYVNAAIATTPSSYLVSTITNLQNRINSKQPIPVLSGRFIDKINKYLTL